LAPLQAAGAQPVAIGALLVLGDAAEALAAAHGVPLVTLARVPQRIWTPAECALCAAGAPLDPPVT
jgi:orotate phosphoribosyltransferase